MSEETIKPCPNTECDNDTCPPFRNKYKGVIICADCGMEVNEGYWNVLPRRDEIYAELTELIEWMESGCDSDLGTANVCLKPDTTIKKARELADKYAPAE